MIISQSDFHSNPFSGFRHTPSQSRLFMRYFIKPRVTPLYYHYFNEPSICDAFDNSHVQYISDTLHIIRSVFKPQFIHCTKYAKYAFLLLSSILHCWKSHVVIQIGLFHGI